MLDSMNKLTIFESFSIHDYYISRKESIYRDIMCYIVIKLFLITFGEYICRIKTCQKTPLNFQQKS